MMVTFFYKWFSLWIGLQNKVFLGGPKSRFMSPHANFLQPNLRFWSELQSASNEFKFGMHPKTYGEKMNSIRRTV